LVHGSNSSSTTDHRDRFVFLEGVLDLYVKFDVLEVNFSSNLETMEIVRHVTGRVIADRRVSLDHNLELTEHRIV